MDPHATGRPSAPQRDRSGAAASRDLTRSRLAALRLADLEPLVARSATELAHERRRHLDAEIAAARDEARTAGHAEGLAAGREEVRRAVARHEEASARLERAAAALEQAAAQLGEADAVTLRELESQATAMAVEIAAALVGRELASITCPLDDAVARAAGLVPDRGDVVLHVHPDDVDAAAPAAHARFGDRPVVVRPDAAVEPGGCVVTVGAVRIDAQIGPAVERLRAAVRRA